MTRHLADHRSASQGGRVRHFLRIARDRSESAWQALFRRRSSSAGGNRRVVEYVRIARQEKG